VLFRSLGAARWAQRSAAALASIDDDRGAACAMVRDGDVWTVSFAAKTIRCKDSKGLRDLASLLANPGVDIPATVLAGTPETGARADEVIDQRAREEIAARLHMLDSDIERADQRGDPAASARAVAERDALLRELQVTSGLAGRSRRLGDPAERARKAVQARVHDSILRIEQQHAGLGRHLRDSVVTGRSCSYRPRDSAVRWDVRQNESGD